MGPPYKYIGDRKPTTVKIYVQTALCHKSGDCEAENNYLGGNPRFDALVKGDMTSSLNAWTLETATRVPSSL
ncbi:hypothetical protein KXD40_000668 [Peronospora effusa]|uniref:Uncharacterized protein n=1 Tax=Peronospora effusa TaxID=542832 RepID=A0A3M6VK57_9STRA|nr:hypothetical protein DD238_004591 [Peronospora effusa]RQM14988.1 hypothetical protein DD237_005003 [Peronospora effusa]UIZ20579.1 hypothetical protein KXD40_000668 [Peronospora effusa]